MHTQRTATKGISSAIDHQAHLSINVGSPILHPFFHFQMNKMRNTPPKLQNSSHYSVFITLHHYSSLVGGLNPFFSICNALQSLQSGNVLNCTRRDNQFTRFHRGNLVGLCWRHKPAAAGTPQKQLASPLLLRALQELQQICTSLLPGFG